MKQTIKTVRPLIVFCTLVVFSLLSGCHAASLTLVQDGQPRAEIVISQQPERTVRLAAQQLQDYVVKISGAKLPIVTKPSGNAVKVFVGHSTYTDDLKVTAKGLKAGAYRIASGADWIVLIGDDTNFTPVEPWAHRNADLQRAQEDWNKITGMDLGLPNGGMYNYRQGYPGNTGLPTGVAAKEGEKLAFWLYDERGSFNAVCGLLRKLGVRWYMPGELGEVVPKLKTIALPEMDETVRPDFPIRRFVRINGDVAKWYMHLGLRSPYGLNTAHGMNDLIYGFNNYATTHHRAVIDAPPDWFALYNGKRDNQRDGTHNQLCYSSEGLFQATVRYARAQFDTYHYDTVSIMPPDGYTSICQCPLCEGKDTPERGARGVYSDYVWDFVNRVAKEVEKTNPGKIITCAAYSSYSLPPLKIAKLEPNVQVVIVGGRLPVHDKPEERKFIRQLRKDWEAKTSNPILIFENYPFTDRGFYLPAYQPHLLGESINATKGFSDGEDIWFSAPSETSLVDLGYNAFPLYFTARMYWGGKDADVDAMFREYCKLFYGPASQEMHSFYTYCEENWREMDKDKTKADKALTLFAKAKSKADASSVYGKRIALVDDYLNGLRNKSKQLGKKRGEVPEVNLGNEPKLKNMRNIVIDGKLDDAFWKNCPISAQGSLRELETGQAPAFGTTFKAGWVGNSAYFAIRCEERPGEKPNDASTRKDSGAIWMGDCIEIELETDSHSHYQIVVSPSGVVTDLDWSAGKLGFLWDSQAEVATQIGDGYWTAEIRIPVTEDANDPLHQVIGSTPTSRLPWFFNVCRQRIRENGSENSAFSPTGTRNFHNELKFAYFYTGQGHKFDADPDDDYLNDIKHGDYTQAAAREKVTERQKSYALELAAAKERNLQKWDAAEKLTAQIPIEVVKQTAQMQSLFAQGKAAEVIKNFGAEKISAWPFWKRGDGYYIRGQAYAATSAGKEAVADYKHALEFTSGASTRQRINLDLAQAYEQLLKDDTAALPLYREVSGTEADIHGRVPLSATQSVARILTRQGKYEEALKELDRINTDRLHGHWRNTTLLARGETLAVAGRKAEATAVYKQVLAGKSVRASHRKAAETALQKLSVEGK